MTIYSHLAPFQPFLTGPWHWVTYAAIVAPFAVVLWVMFGRRWKPDGVLRCAQCRHVFDPETQFAGTTGAVGARCPECGAITLTEQAALRRGNRKRLIAASMASAFLLALPLMAWHSVHVFVARTLMPRWVTEGRAEFANGLTLVYEVDPLQEWFHLEPNTADGAWRGNFEDLVPVSDADLNSGWNNRTCYMWPDRCRVRVWTNANHPMTVTTLGPFVFGAEGFSPNEEQSMPPIGSPGFGGDITGDGIGDVIVGEVNIGSLGGTTWMRVTEPVAATDVGGDPVISTIGVGVFRRDVLPGEWNFMSVCHGFRYGITPGAFSQDPLIACKWDNERSAWIPNMNRMRREPHRSVLEAHAASALEHYRQCLADAAAMVTSITPKGESAGAHAPTRDPAAAAIEALRDGRAGMGDFLPCPEMIGSLADGVLELMISGHGAEWEEWVRLAWPAEASSSFRDRFIADMRRTIETCECNATLRELNGFPEARPATGATPHGSSLGR